MFWYMTVLSISKIYFIELQCLHVHTNIYLAYFQNMFWQIYMCMEYFAHILLNAVIFYLFFLVLLAAGPPLNEGNDLK